MNKILSILIFLLVGSQLRAAEYDFLRYRVQWQSLKKPEQVRQQKDLVVWKSAKTVEVQEEGTAYAVAWTQQERYKVSKTEIFHNFRTVVNYKPIDGIITAVAHNWQLNHAFFGPQIEKIFTKRPSSLKGSIEIFDYKTAREKSSVFWNSTKQIPERIVIEGSGARVTLDLKSYNDGKDRMYDRVNWRDLYDDLDFADLGDNEAHPLVKNLHHRHQHSQIRYVH